MPHRTRARPIGATRWWPNAAAHALSLNRTGYVVCIFFLSIACAAGCTSLYRKPAADNVVAARQLSLRGIDALQQENWEEAEALFGRAIGACATDERAHCHYAEILWRRGASEQAIDHMEQAVRLSGGDPGLLIDVGEMYLARGDLARAAQQADRAIQSNRQLPGAWALRGDVLRKLGERDQALACFHRALSMQQHYPRVQLRVAEIYREQGRPHRTLSTLQTLADQFPPGQEPAEVLYQQGLALKDLGRYEDAVDSLAAARNRGAPSADLLYHLGEAQMLTGDPSNARLSVLAALAREPGHRPSQQLKAHVESRQQHVAAALHQ
jgi:tetratricopeptide (TPR) repeat protein